MQMVSPKLELLLLELQIPENMKWYLLPTIVVDFA